MAGKEIVVRAATAKDADGLIGVLAAMRLDGELWSKNESFVAEALQALIDDNRFMVLVAESGSSVVGFVSCAVFPSLWECQRQGLIVDFFVHPTYQRQGIGSKLLCALIEKAKKENIGELHVSTGWENKNARKLYGKYGFTDEHLLLERTKEKR